MASTHRAVLGEKDINTSLTPNKAPSPESTVLDKRKHFSSLQASLPENVFEAFRAPMSDQGLEIQSLGSHPQFRKRSLEETANEHNSTDDVKAVGSKRPKVDETLGGAQGVEEGIWHRGDGTIPSTKSAQPSSVERLASPFQGDGQIEAHGLSHSNDSYVQTSQDTQAASIPEPPTVVDSSQEASTTEMLRARLRLAMFKVRTEQTDASISKLEFNLPTSPPKQELVIRDPPEKTMRRYYRKQARQKRCAQTKSTACLLPAFESSFDISTQQEIGNRLDIRQDFAEINSRSHSVQGPDYDGEMLTEATPVISHSRDDASTYSGDQSDDEMSSEYMRRGRLDRLVCQDTDLTSSALKGRAADSLLQLGMSRS